MVERSSLFSLSCSKRDLIFFVGRAGSGKSTLATQVGEAGPGKISYPIIEVSTLVKGAMTIADANIESRKDLQDSTTILESNPSWLSYILAGATLGVYWNTLKTAPSLIISGARQVQPVLDVVKLLRPVINHLVFVVLTVPDSIRAARLGIFESDLQSIDRGDDSLGLSHFLTILAANKLFPDSYVVYLDNSGPAVDSLRDLWVNLKNKGVTI